MGDRSKKNKKLVRKNKESLVEDVEDRMGKPRSTDSSPCGARESSKESKRKRPVKERWLLTRKTWRYMADAGRRLIPDGAHNRPEDIPKIEAYFQEVCHREPRFLLWRKSSYPGALGFRSHHRKNRRKKGGSCREKASSADEAEDLIPKGTMVMTPTGGGKFDLHRLRQEFFHHDSSKPGSPSSTKGGFPSTSISKGSPITPSGSDRHPFTFPTKGEGSSMLTGRSTESLGGVSEEEEQRDFINTLRIYLAQQEEEEGAQGGVQHEPIDFHALLDQLRKHLSSLSLSSDEESRHKAGYDASVRDSTTLSQGPSQSSGPWLKPPDRSVHFTGDHQQKMLQETLSRYYSKSTSRHKVISDMLTDRKLLEKLYFDLRKTRGFSSGHRGSALGGHSPTWTSDSSLRSTLRRREGSSHHDNIVEEDYGEPDSTGSWNKYGKTGRRFRRDVSPFSSPPPLIEVQNEAEVTSVDIGIQTPPIPPSMLASIEDYLKKERESSSKEEVDGKECKDKGGGSRRRSSVDHDDVSPSVSDTIKRYLQMARKKSKDSDKVDRFKRVNYDRNLRNIKAKGEITKPGDDDGLNKGAQTDECWVDAMRELKLGDVYDAEPDPEPVSRVPSSRSSVEGEECAPATPHRGLLSSGQTFLSNLLHGLQGQPVTGSACVSPAAMQKSKSSSSVVQHGSRLVAKKLWRVRSKSQGRTQTSPASTWTPQGRCTWSSMSGRSVTLGDTSLLQLSELERRVLHKVALAKLQALNLGVAVRVPTETVGSVTHKPKRRAYLLKRKALTTGFFDTARGKDGDKDKDGCGLVFGISLSQCLENDRLRCPRGSSPGPGPFRAAGDEALELRRKSHHGSRTSFSSLIETARAEESGSCESLMSPMVGSDPGLLDTLSCGSTADTLLGPADMAGAGVPQLVTACFRHLEAFGLYTLGLFRVSTSKKRVRQLREAFDAGQEVALGEDHCPHDVATLLKEFFRDLPEPLLCRDLYHAFVQTQRIRNRRLQSEALQHLVQLLPTSNRDTLAALLSFLATVARHSADSADQPGNKMDSSNLATVFAPNVLHCLKPGHEMSADRAEDRIDVINVVRSMIEQNKELFQVPAELLDEVYLHMMDSHPEALDQLLRRREVVADDILGLDDLEGSGLEGTGSETTLGSDLTGDLDEQPRRMWSREEFLHETAGMGGPDMAMRPRHKERVRERSSKKRWREEPGKYSRQTSASSTATLHSESPPPDGGGGIITASLKIPVPSGAAPPASASFAVSLDDGDIPYIEDAAEGASRQQMTIGLVRSGSTNATQRRRQRSASGSDSSQASMGAVQAVLQQGSDSALGSSATFSSPPRNTTPSVCSSSGGEAGLCSSPPSWASSPPTSPDASHTTVDFIPEDTQSAKISIPTGSKSVKGSGSMILTKEVTPVILQKVTFTSTSELRQVQRTGDSLSQVGTLSRDKQVDQSAMGSSRTWEVHQRAPGELPKSASTSAVITAPPTSSQKNQEDLESRKLTTSISSIGGAVMRSKTADIERMLKIQKAEAAVAVVTPKPTPHEDKKKYTKRRYTDSRHQTRHIPDADALGKDAGSLTEASAAATPITAAQRRSQGQGPVWKRRELIASDPKEHETFL